MTRSDHLTALVEAALDERDPSPRLVRAVQRYLIFSHHPDRLRWEHDQAAYVGFSAAEAL